MKKSILEACVDSVESAIAAQNGGADRLEVCSNLIIGGTTPGVGEFKQMRKLCKIGLNVLIRPRFGDFLYTDSEFQMILEDVRMFRELGADGVVVGCLKPNGELDLERMETLCREAGSMHVTLHRAFDVCKDPYRALEEAVSLGIHTILTSGQQNICIDGKELLGELIKQAGDRIEILVGSGVNAEIIGTLIDEIGATSFHMSGKMKLDSQMQYRKENVDMGMPGIGEYDIFRTDEKQIRKARTLMDEKLNGMTA